MGEVYRADDLKLGQPVALKFLSEELKQTPERLLAFLNEVKLARQVRHPNVCAVFDADEVDGHHFLTMEYVDGEDLETLCRRIGRPPPEKALEIACQLCAGLEAIHARGILHRDLKPANVMLDGRGRVRISDFGVAASAHNVQEGEICGTPEYMSPEQLAAERATIQSDLYSLGLLLFQLFTGRRAFSSVEARLSKESTPPDPLETVGDLDPSVGEAIRSCLRPDPGDRPSSAAALLGILAQGNPMRALLGSDNTPPAEVVAAVGGSGSFDRSMAVWLTGIVVLGLLLIMWAADQVRLFRQVDPTLPPEALTQRARDLLRRVGYSGLARDTAFGFGHALSPRSFDWPSQEDPGDTDERSGAGWPNLYFWYRESSEFFRPQDPLSRVSAPDPPFVPFPGAVSVVLDPGGRLWELQITPQPADGNQEDDGQAGFDHFIYEPPVFPYDMLLIASSKPISSLSLTEAIQALSLQSPGRLVLALLQGTGLIPSSGEQGET